MLRKNKDLASLKSKSSNSKPFIRAGTTGVRHLFPIHLYNESLFCRTISHVRSHQPTNELATNTKMVRDISSSIQTLEYFDISQSQFEELPNEISLLNHLKSLNCSHNKLKTIGDSFEKLNHLKQLDLSFNHFKRLPDVVYKFKYLTRLNVEHNLLKQIDSDLVKNKYLKVLILDHNEIQTMDAVDLSQMKKLECLHIAHNQLIHFPQNLYRLNHLKNVNLSHNRLTYFPIELLLINTLDVLNLSHNLFTQLPTLTGLYKRTTLIFSIDLSFNQLTKIYDYLLFISLKIDLSNNRIETISNNLMKAIKFNTIKTRELKLHHNPLIYPTIPTEVLNEENLKSRNMLDIIRSYYDEQLMNEPVRQGFKVFITGCKNSGKSSLAYCLEEYRPLINDEKGERFLNIFQFPFYCDIDNDDPSQASIDVNKQKKLSKQSTFLTFVTPPSSSILESKKPLPLTIFDFNGSVEHYEHISIFIDTRALHIICIHAMDFNKQTPTNIEDVFKENFDIQSYPMIKQLFQILKILCEKIANTGALMILPIATFIDVYDKQYKHEKNQLLEKINKFFKLYFENRSNRLNSEIEKITCRQIIPSSLSDRLKTYNSLVNLSIQIESCQSISSLTREGIDELNKKIQHCITTQKTIFPNINRSLPTLWADTNQYIESLADKLPTPYLQWEKFTKYVKDKYGLSNIIDDIAMSLSDQGKITIFNEIGTTNRMIFLRPLWLGDVISSLFKSNSSSETTLQSYRNEYHENGRLHCDLMHSLWSHLLNKKECLYNLCNVLIRYLLVGYPQLNRKQLKSFLNGEEVKFDYMIIPYYLPMISLKEQQHENERFFVQTTTKVHVCYKSFMLPAGIFHRYSTLILLKTDINYINHLNNFLIAEHKEKQVKLIIETNHQTYINIHCGTNVSEKPFDQIWNVLMSILNLFEEMCKILVPGSLFDRCACCPYCNEYSFMGEWTTPKELQGLKIKACSSCGENVDTNYLIQPNENKRRNEELLKKIRERNANRPIKSGNKITSKNLDQTS